MASRSAAGAGTVSGKEQGMVAKAAARCVCPACSEPGGESAIERYGKYELFDCATCGMHFWEPREMPDAQWYEQMYGGRDKKLLPLEPGHKYFLADSLAPPGGSLLDIGCGTGNFLAAAGNAGYQVTGTELDRNAAVFAKERLGLQRVLPLTISEFAGQCEGEKFDVVTFFEVLEHQAEPAEFLQKVKACLKTQGTIAMSVPNRERWLTGPDVLDYPPNHFLRWNAAALKLFLAAQGFDILSMREQPASVGYTAQMINIALRTGMTQPIAAEAPASFREMMQMGPEQATAVPAGSPTMRQRALQALAQIKFAACFPLAVAAFPYVRMRGYKGTYLYCLARRRD
ncbi:MAG TPA: class I SAM-dependent methyltransferase [Candidatus Acidoferrum sp.]|nr:class I SAM-dependent methyltransferase [Candidatus Acidoferrum sp.]